MKGWLIVNAFLQTQKFQRLYAYLENAANARGVCLQCVTNQQVWQFLQNDANFAIRKPDFVIFWDKDVRLAECLQHHGLRLFNSAAAVENCDDKQRTALCLQAAGLAMPETIIAPKTFDGVGYTQLSFLDFAENRLGYPFIVKEAYGSFGAQVYLVENRPQAETLVMRLAGKPILMQKFISESYGRDIRVNVVGDRAVCAIFRENQADFRSNITNGGTATAIVPTKEIEDLAVAACKAVGADFAGVDILLGKDGALVCEVNSNPHFESTFSATGIDISQNVIDYIRGLLCTVG